jgi:hypothetical protein
VKRALRRKSRPALLGVPTLDKPKLHRPDCLMHSFRILLALLIALALPAQALADAHMAADCCPMSAEAAPETLSTGHDCCHENDADGAGMSCDAGSCCPCGAHLALTLDVFLTATHERAHTPALFPTPPYPAPPDAHWRPPASRTDLI